MAGRGRIQTMSANFGLMQCLLVVTACSKRLFLVDLDPPNALDLGNCYAVHAQCLPNMCTVSMWCIPELQCWPHLKAKLAGTYLLLPAAAAGPAVHCQL